MNSNQPPIPKEKPKFRTISVQFAIRCLGTLAGIGFVAIGAYAKENRLMAPVEFFPIKR